VSAQKSLNYEKLILAKNTFSPCGRLAMSLPVLLLAVAVGLANWALGTLSLQLAHSQALECVHND